MRDRRSPMVMKPFNGYVIQKIKNALHKKQTITIEISKIKRG
jgi:hypothetical protein